MIPSWLVLFLLNSKSPDRLDAYENVLLVSLQIPLTFITTIFHQNKI